MEIFGLKNCDTCRKALKSLPQATFIDVRADGMPENILDSALAQFGQALVNTRSTTWRQLSEDARTSPHKDLLQAHPAVMKRPLIKAGDQFFLGWTSATQDALKAL